MIKKTPYLILFCISCNSSTKNCNTSHQKIILNDNQKEEIQEINDCNGHVFYSQEVIRLSKDSFINDGLYKEFYDNGKIKAQSSIKRNLREGITIKYRNNGKVEFENYYENDELRGFQKIFYPNGSIKTKYYNKNNDQVIFKAHYDEKGSLDSVEGQTFRIDLSKDVEKYVLGDKVIVLNEAIVMDEANSLLEVKILYGRKTIVDTSISEFITLKNRHIGAVFFTPRIRGIYNYSATVSLLNKKNGTLIKKSTIEFPIKIR